MAARRLRRDVQRLFAAAAAPARTYHEAQLVGLPTAIQTMPGAGIVWMAVDEHSAWLTFTQNGQSATCLVRFNERDEIAACETTRYFDDTTQRHLGVPLRPVPPPARRTYPNRG